MSWTLVICSRQGAIEGEKPSDHFLWLFSQIKYEPKYHHKRIKNEQLGDNWYSFTTTVS